jgi:hypothetical protein
MKNRPRRQTLGLEPPGALSDLIGGSVGRGIFHKNIFHDLIDVREKSRESLDIADKMRRVFVASDNETEIYSGHKKQNLKY